MNKNELWQLLCQKEKEFEAAKQKRATKTWLGFSVFYYILLYWLESPTGFDLIGNVFVALVFAGIHFLVNAVVFSNLCKISASENKHLEDLRKQLSEMK